MRLRRSHADWLPSSFSEMGNSASVGITFVTRDGSNYKSSAGGGAPAVRFAVVINMCVITQAKFPQKMKTETGAKPP